MTTATVRLWGTTIGYVSMDEGERFARFEFDPDFARAGIELAPLQMPAAAGRVYQFPELHPRSFHGLPGLLADWTGKNFHPGKKLLFAFFWVGWENKFLAGRKHFHTRGRDLARAPPVGSPW